MMDGGGTLDWAAGNAQVLDLAYQRLTAALTGADVTALHIETQISVIEGRMPAPSSPARIARAFGLSDTMMQTLLLAALADQPPALSGVLQAHRHAAGGRATPAVVADVLDNVSQLAADAPLCRHGLLTMDTAARFYERPIIVPDSVGDALRGLPGPGGLVRSLLRPAPFAASPGAAVAALEQLWRQACRTTAPVTLFIAPGDIGASLAQFATAVRGSGQVAWVLPSDAIPADPAERAALATLLRRDAILADLAVAVVVQTAPHQAWDFVDRLDLPCLLIGDDPPDNVLGQTLRVPAAAGASGWDLLLEPQTAAAPHVREVARTFALNVNQIRRTVAACAAGTAPDLMTAARAEVGNRMDRLAQPIPVLADWDDLILPPTQRAALDQMAHFLTHRDTVLTDWGFAAKSGRGLGMAALFHGLSGTGKTTAAEALIGRMRSARGDRVPLYRVNVAALVSKYIGETAKNFETVFDAGAAMGAALLFDEADGLFGKRTGAVKDSIDKHANAELGFLLQCLEAYPGVAILTTNMRASIDDAFFRRFRFAIEFPFPDQALRHAIWQRVLPDAMPRAVLDYTALSGPALSGGAIRSAAINAAYRAAADGTPLTMMHLAQAVRLEFAKLDKPAPDRDLRGWV